MLALVAAASFVQPCSAQTDDDIALAKRLSDFPAVTLEAQADVFDGGSRLFKFSGPAGGKLTLFLRHRNPRLNGNPQYQDVYVLFDGTTKLSDGFVLNERSSPEATVVRLVREARQSARQDERGRASGGVPGKQWLLDRISDRRRGW